ncbi:DUF1501 domain-containing protein [Nocardioides zeae]|uniref:DUF1501 domain-containing protein n=1 Tax=Nocardioides imazamoxiresistens TaxID=3231893 RepID=A0ABU3PT37_9ACTN|nr:DUF1501 domain-containing protein [Nocardioides zeae]MDT9592402.1 DUF1501 domain-containing protein [Nocardioides zeae]
MSIDPTPVAPGAACCGEYASMSRRGVLRGALLGSAVAAFGGAVVRTAPAYAGSAAAAAGGGNVLVVLSLRGACDGLSMVVPHADPVYYRARPRIAVAADQLLARDAMFGLHPSFRPLLPMWTAGRLAAVHATGLPAPNRSHFSAMEEVEDASPGSSAREGWLNRLLGTTPSSHALEGVAVGDGRVPTSLWGAQAVTTMRDPGSVTLAGADQWDKHGGRPRSVSTLWGASQAPLADGVRTALQVVDDFAPVRATSTAPANGAVYPTSELGKALAHVSRVIRGDIGSQVITVDQGEWDTHTDQGTLTWGAMRGNIGDLASSLAAFFTDLGTTGDRVTLVALSEFGRRVRENANYGTDHGYGNVMLVAGAGVKGGRYYGTWTPLVDTPDSDVLVTTDYRSVLAEVVRKRFGASTAAVFPGFSPATVGVL